MHARTHHRIFLSEIVGTKLHPSRVKAGAIDAKKVEMDHKKKKMGEEYPETLALRLYYPNRWRMYIGDLVEPEDRTFCWWLCSKRFYDPATEIHVIEIVRGIIFYEEATGHTFSLPDDGLPSPKLLILDDFPPEKGDPTTFAKKHGYQGLASKNGKCDLARPDDFLLCHDATFYFFPGFLTVSKKEGACDVVKFSKERSSQIRTFLPDFPTPEEIAEKIASASASSEEGGVAKVCQKLYSDLVLFDRTRSVKK